MWVRVPSPAPISNIRPCSKARRCGLQICVGQFNSDAGCHFKCPISITDRTLGYEPREGRFNSSMGYHFAQWCKVKHAGHTGARGRVKSLMRNQLKGSEALIVKQSALTRQISEHYRADPPISKSPGSITGNCSSLKH